jgi:uncharacterized membrane protein
MKFFKGVLIAIPISIVLWLVFYIFSLVIIKLAEII